MLQCATYPANKFRQDFLEDMNYLKVSTIIFLLILFLASARPAFGAVRCETQYGGGEVCVRTGQIQINKKVWDPSSSQFVDNLGITTHKFTAGDEITFRLEIKNVGDATFDKVSVTDTLPDFLEKISGDLTFEISDLTVGETETREIKAKVVSADKLPSDKSIICVVNTAEVTANSDHDKDTAQACLEKKVLGVKTFPAAGPENWLIILSLSLLTGLAGISLRLATKFKLS